MYIKKVWTLTSLLELLPNIISLRKKCAYCKGQNVQEHSFGATSVGDELTLRRDRESVRSLQTLPWRKYNRSRKSIRRKDSGQCSSDPALDIFSNRNVLQYYCASKGKAKSYTCICVFTVWRNRSFYFKHIRYLCS